MIIDYWDLITNFCPCFLQETLLRSKNYFILSGVRQKSILSLVHKEIIKKVLLLGDLHKGTQTTESMLLKGAPITAVGELVSSPSGVQIKPPSG